MPASKIVLLSKMFGAKKAPKTETVDITPSPVAIMSILAGRPVPVEGEKTKPTPRGDISALLNVGRVRVNGRYASADGKINSTKGKTMAKKTGATKVDGRGAKPKFEKSVNGLVRDLFADASREMTTDEVVTALTKS